MKDLRLRQLKLVKQALKYPRFIFITLQVDKNIAEKRSVGTSTSIATLTEPDCLGPCEPGTSVTLEGIVWQETEGGRGCLTSMLCYLTYNIFVLILRHRRARGERHLARQDVRGHAARLYEARLGAAALLRVAHQ